MAWTPKFPAFKMPELRIVKPSIPADIQQVLSTRTSKTTLWIGNFLGVIFSFIGLCGAADNGIAEWSLGWLWWCLMLHLVVSTFGILKHLQPSMMEKVRLPHQIYMLASFTSFMILMLAMDHSIQLAGFTV
jgi:hypothetical protein